MVFLGGCTSTVWGMHKKNSANSASPPPKLNLPYAPDQNKTHSSILNLNLKSGHRTLNQDFNSRVLEVLLGAGRISSSTVEAVNSFVLNNQTQGCIYLKNDHIILITGFDLKKKRRPHVALTVYLREKPIFYRSNLVIGYPCDIRHKK